MKEDFYQQIKSEPSWQNSLTWLTHPDATIHLAVMVEPFLSAVLNGQKTVESRFSRHKIAPYHKVQPGDLVLLKQTSGPVVGSFEVAFAEYYELNNEVLKQLKQTYGKTIAAPSDFWEAQKAKHHATFLGVKNMQQRAPVPVRKKDPRAWVVL